MARLDPFRLSILAAALYCALPAQAQYPIVPAVAPSPVVVGDQYYFAVGIVNDECFGRNFSIESGEIPPGLTAYPTQEPRGLYITGRPTTAGTYQFRVAATPPVGNSCGLPVERRDYTIAVVPFALQPATLSPAALGQSYQASLSVNSQLSSGCFQYQMTGGGMPPGMSFIAPPYENPTITGTPTAAGSFNFRVTVRELECEQSSDFRREISTDYVLDVYGLTTLSLVDGTQGRPYSQQFQDTFPPTPTYTAELPLPAGMTLSPSGLLGGTPTNAGTFVVRVRASSSTLPSGVTGVYTLRVNPPVSLPTSALPDGAIGIPYPPTQVPTSGGTTPILFSIVSGSLPPGLSLSPGRRLASTFSKANPRQAGFPGTSGGILSGTPTSEGTFTFVIRAEEAYGGTAERSFTMAVNGAPAISPPTLPGGVVGVSYSQLLTLSGVSVSAPSFQIESGTLPPGLSLSPSGAITGTPSTQGSYSFAVRTSFQNAIYRRDYTIVIGGSLTFVTPVDLPQGRTGASYSLTFQAAGGVPPYSINNEVVSVPPGMTYNPSTFTLSGTPTTAGNYTIDLILRDSNQPAGSVFRSFRLSVVNGAVITTTSLPSGALNTAYRATLASSGFSLPPTWTIPSSALPPGLVLDPAAGVISGTPTAEGTYPFQVSASTSTQSATPKALQISIGTPSLDFSPESLPAATVGVPYAQSFTPTGGDGTYVFSQPSGAPPPGVSVSTTGAIAGTPTAAGTFRFTVRVTSGARLIEKLITLFVDTVSLDLSPTSLSDATVNSSYNQALVASGGKAPYQFQVSAGSLPPGIVLGQAGVLSGTPTASGAFAFSVLVNDANNKQLVRGFTINVRTSVMITTGSLPDGTEAEAYTATLQAGGGLGPYTFAVSAGTLPPGIALAANGALSGTPTQGGSFNFTVGVTDANQRTGTASLSIRVFSLLSFATTTLPEALLLRDYTAQLAAQGGQPEYRFEIASGTLPDGLIFNNGTLRGAATRAGSFAFDAKVTDSRLRTATRRFVMVVGSGPSVTIQGAPPAGQNGVAYTAQFTVTGGTAPYRWSFTGSLPPGLNLEPSTGLVSGTPTATGTFNFTLRAEDSNNLAASTPFSITIGLGPLPPVSLTTNSTSSGPSDQVGFSLSLATPYPAPVDGVVSLDFKPDRGFDDPAVTFANGARTLTFTVPAGNTQANFTISRTALQTGTVAGMITLASKLTVAGDDVTPNPAPAQTIRIDPAAPVITRLDVNKTATGFELIVFGFATPRQVTQALVRLTPVAGVTLPATDFPVAVTSVFNTWYADSASIPFGSQFRLVLPFAVSESGVIQSASVTLSNSVGNSAPATVNF
jgi:hypothetical protein